MPAFHSKHNNEENVKVIGRLSILPFRTNIKGVAPVPAPGKFQREVDPKTGVFTKGDILDEALEYFKANVLFRFYEVKGGADILLVYCTLYISQCLGKLKGKNKADASKTLFSLAVENFSLPGDGAFPLGTMVAAPANAGERDFLRDYLKQLRQELGNRLIDKVYAANTNTPDKWWICFSKRKFLDMAL